MLNFRCQKTLFRAQAYDVARIGFCDDHKSCDLTLILGAQDLDDQVLRYLRSRHSTPAKVLATGKFKTRQQEITTENKLAFASASAVNILNFSRPGEDIKSTSKIFPLYGDLSLLEPHDPNAQKRIFIFLRGDEWARLDKILELEQLTINADARVWFVVSSKEKEIFFKAFRLRAIVIPFSELSYSIISRYADLCLVFGQSDIGAMVENFLAACIARGGVVIDATNDKSILAECDVVVRAPTSVPAVSAFLNNVVYPKFLDISRQVAISAWRRDLRFDFWDVARAKHPKPKSEVSKKSKIFFMPTNGMGLGHAQRCLNVARSLTDLASEVPAEFAAHPSCVGMVRQSNFSCWPLVPKSDEHQLPFSNDIVNYKRLLRQLKDGDTFVFDGVFVFDSVMRSVLEGKLNAIWIRRGLWNSQQDNTTALMREFVFSRVIIPQEVFPELNETYSHSDKIVEVGPIVNQLVHDRKVAEMRQALTSLFDFDVTKIVVSMLGAGVAADRSIHIQSLCAAFEKHSNVGHIVLVWPNASVSPETFLWKRTRVVKSVRGLEIMKCADFVVSAVGYNTFHEIIYHRIPAIFVPQTAPFMDDQERRAAAAVSRGLAAMASESDGYALGSTVDNWLRDDSKVQDLKGALHSIGLPPVGNKKALSAILEVHDGF